MRIYVRNIPAKFHPDPIWNDEVLGYFWRRSPQQEEPGGSYIRSVPDLKTSLQYRITHISVGIHRDCT